MCIQVGIDIPAVLCDFEVIGAVIAKEVLDLPQVALGELGGQKHRLKGVHLSRVLLRQLIFHDGEFGAFTCI